MSKTGLAFAFFGIMAVGGMLPVPTGPILAAIGFITGILLIASDSNRRRQEPRNYNRQTERRPTEPATRTDKNVDLEEWP